MGRPLTPSEAIAALRRGVEIEQFLNLTAGELRFLTISRTDEGFALTEHHVHDEGTDDFADISEFRPVNDDEEVGEGRRIALVATAEEAVQAAATCGGSEHRWVNQAMAADDYVTAKRG